MEQQAYDTARDQWLRDREYRVLRFWDSDVLTRLDSVEQAIWEALHQDESGPEGPLPHPPPRTGEGIEQ